MTRAPLIACAGLLALTACGEPLRTEPYATAPQPEDALFLSAVPAGHTAYDNSSLADIFVRLTHGLESGKFRRALQRFEKPVSVGMVGPGAERYVDFLDMALDQIVRETGAPIAAGPGPHDLLIRFVPGEEFLPETTAQCVVVFGQPSWQELKADPRLFSSAATRKITEQTLMSVIIPDTVEPYKVRECLLEEITQALGPANDLYGLAWTIFNDDDAHTWPTKLDYLMLRVLYDGDMESGLSQGETRRRAKAVLDRINPQGIGAPALPKIHQHMLLDWRGKLHALDTRRTDMQAIWAARQIAAKARDLAPDSAYDCTGATNLAHMARGSGVPDEAKLLDEAIALCTRVHGADDIRLAVLRLERAYAHIAAKRFAEAEAEAAAVLPQFLAFGREGYVAATLVVRLRAAHGTKDKKRAAALRPQVLAWVAYAYGDDHDLTADLRD